MGGKVSHLDERFGELRVWDGKICERIVNVVRVLCKSSHEQFLGWYISGCGFIGLDVVCLF